MDVTPAFEEDRRPSHVKAWTAKLRREGKQGKDGPEPLSASYVYACHARLAQIMSDAVHDGIIPRSPCSRRTSPGQGQQRPYVATTEQLWALHDIVPERIRAAILLGALAGLRLAEACALRASDVDFMRGIIYPRVQYPAEPLKTDISKTPIPVGRSLAPQLAAHVKKWPGETVLVGADGGPLSPWALERAIRTARKKADGLPSTFRYHDLRHFLSALFSCRDSRHRRASGPAACPVRLPPPRCRLLRNQAETSQPPAGVPTATRVPPNTASAERSHYFASLLIAHGPT